MERGGGGCEGTEGDGDVEEVRQIWEAEVVGGFECIQEDFEIFVELDPEKITFIIV